MTQVARHKIFLSVFLGLGINFTALGQASSLELIKFSHTENSKKIKFYPFTAKDLLTNAPMSTSSIELFDGRTVPMNHYLTELNQIEKELASLGYTLRSELNDLGVVASATNEKPQFHMQATPPASNQNDARWSHELYHDIASISARGQVTQRNADTPDFSDMPVRTTSHAISGRFLNAQSSSIAQVIQRVVLNENGLEQKETQVYINGKQLFRRGRVDDTEARIWTTAFDIPLKDITVPVGPGSVQAKIGIRGNVHLDLELNPSRSANPRPQFNLNFKPQILADGYISTATTPTNVGEAGVQGAITLAKNTLEVNGEAALVRGMKVEVKQATVDNTFEGFNGRIVAYANITVPGKKADGSNKKRFEKELYSWEGIKVAQRIFEYKAPIPQPTAK